jgi:hypothetical protein
MNFYEDESLEQKLEELSDQMGYIVLEILLLSLKKLGNENRIFSDIMESKLAAKFDEPF